MSSVESVVKTEKHLVVARPRLVDALQLADHVSPSPTESSAAMKILRLALADALAMTIPELLASAEGYETQLESGEGSA